MPARFIPRTDADPEADVDTAAETETDNDAGADADAETDAQPLPNRAARRANRRGKDAPATNTGPTHVGPRDQVHDQVVGHRQFSGRRGNR